MRIPSAVQDFLHRFDIQITHWSQMVDPRRERILRDTRAEVLIDVGANAGQYADAARRAGYAGRIVSYEPVSGPYAQLERRCNDDPRWDCRQIALGAASGVAEINVTEFSYFSSFLAPTNETRRVEPRAEVVRTETVTVETLDDAVDEDAPAAALAVKIDTQGFEHEVIAGGKVALGRAVYLELELSLVPTYEGAPTLVPMLEQVYDLGFHLALTENLLYDQTTGHALQINGVFVRD